MPYDPRTTSDGGHRGIDIDFSRKAPPGKFRVVGVDTFDGTDWCESDFATKEEAVRYAQGRGGPMLKMHVYNDEGVHVAQAGTF